MKGFLGVVVLLGAMVAGESRADLLEPNYLLDVEARLGVALDGTVTDVDVHGIEDGMLRGRVVERLQRWTFEVPPDEDDRAESYAVSARFQLMAVAEGGHMQVRMRRPNLSTRPIGENLSAEDWQYRGGNVERTAIRHPNHFQIRSSLGAAPLETEIVFLVSFGPDGRVVQTGVRSIELFDTQVRKSEQATMERLLRPYVVAGTRGLQRWRFPEATGENPPAVRSILVPVYFTTRGGERTWKPGQWRHALNVDSMVDDWARPRGNQRAVAELAEDSDDFDQRLVLLATEDDLVL